MTQLVFVDDSYFPCPTAANTALYVLIGITWTPSSYWHKALWITDGVCPTESVRQGKALTTDMEIVGLRKREWSEMQNKHHSSFFCEVLKGSFHANFKLSLADQRSYQGNPKFVLKVNRLNHHWSDQFFYFKNFRQVLPSLSTDWCKVSALHLSSYMPPPAPCLFFATNGCVQ